MGEGEGAVGAVAMGTTRKSLRKTMVGRSCCHSLQRDMSQAQAGLLIVCGIQRINLVNLMNLNLAGKLSRPLLNDLGEVEIYFIHAQSSQAAFEKSSWSILTWIGPDLDQRY